MSLAYNSGILTEGLTLNLDVSNSKSRLGPNLISNSTSISKYPANQNVTVSQNGKYIQAVTNQNTSTPGVYPITNGAITVTANTYYTVRIKAYSGGSTPYLYVYGINSGTNLVWTGAAIGTTLGWYENTFNTGSNTSIQLGFLWSSPTTGSLIEIEDYCLHQSSTWYDLSSNKIDLYLNGTLNYTTIGNVPCFQFNSSMYWQSTTAKAQSTDYRYGQTLEFWVYAQSISTRKNIYQKNGGSNGYASYETELAMTWETANNISCYRAYSSYDYGNSPNLNLNTWNHIVLVLYPYLGVGQWYLNGVPGGSYTQRATRWPTLPANEIVVGNGYTGIMDTGAISIVRNYSTMFTPNQVLQNFEALRGKFGV